MTTAKTKKEVDINVPNGTPAKVVQHKDGDGNVKSQTVTFEAQANQNEVDTDSETPSSEDFDFTDLESESFEVAPPIPKTQLEILFSSLRHAIDVDGEPDGFRALLVRQPDPINANYRVRCDFITDLGAFQFSSRDIFAFQSAIQERNGNSGGLFNVRIYRNNQTPLTIVQYVGHSIHRHPVNVEIGLVNYAVPDPVVIDTPANAPNANNDATLLAFMERSDQRFEMLMERMNQPRAESDVEKRIKEKAIDMMFNPQANNNNGSDVVSSVMSSVAVVTALSDAMAKSLNRTPPEPPPPTTFDQIFQAANSDAGLAILDKVGDLTDALKIKLIAPPAATTDATGQQAATQNPDNSNNTMQENEPTEMQELIEDIIEELETENKFDADNQFLKDLQTDYPLQSIVLTAFCKKKSYDEIFLMLDGYLAGMNPHPFVPFLDVEQTQATQSYVWNERGAKMLERLKEFYEFVKTLN